MRRITIILTSLLMSFYLNAQEFLQDDYLVNRSVVKKAGDSHEIAVLKYEVFNLDGSMLFQIEKKHPFDIPFPAPLTADDGSLILVNAFEATIDYYNNNGVYLKTVKLLKEPSPNYERAIYSDIAGDITAHLVTESIERDLLLIRLDKRGNELSRNTLDIGQGAGIEMDNYSGRIAVSHFSLSENDIIAKTTVLNEEGEIIASFPNLFRQAKFTDDGRYIYGFTNKNLFLASLESNDVLMELEAPPGNLLLNALADGEYIRVVYSPNPRLKEGNWIYKNFNYAKYNLAGEMISVKDYKTAQFTKARFVLSSLGVILKLDNSEYLLN